MTKAGQQRIVVILIIKRSQTATRMWRWVSYFNAKLYLQRFGIKGCSVWLDISNWRILQYPNLWTSFSLYANEIFDIQVRFDVQDSFTACCKSKSDIWKSRRGVALLYQGLLKYLKHLRYASKKKKKSTSTFRSCMNATSKVKDGFSVSSVRATWARKLTEWRTHWFECVPNADWPWQGCYNSRKGLYNHLITKTVSQRGSLLAPSMAASALPLAAFLSDWSMLMASQK